MKNPQLEKNVVAQLGRDQSESLNWSQSPSVTLIPFMRRRDSYYLLVSLALKRAIATREYISHVSLLALKSLIDTREYLHFPAIEIAVYDGNGGPMRRRFRITVFADAFDKIRDLTEADMLSGSSPIEGIFYAWPPR